MPNGAEYFALESVPERAFALAWTSTESIPKSFVKKLGAVLVPLTLTVSFARSVVLNSTVFEPPPFFCAYC